MTDAASADRRSRTERNRIAFSENVSFERRGDGSHSASIDARVGRTRVSAGLDVGMTQGNLSDRAFAILLAVGRATGRSEDERRAEERRRPQPIQSAHREIVHDPAGGRETPGHSVYSRRPTARSRSLRAIQ